MVDLFGEPLVEKDEEQDNFESLSDEPLDLPANQSLKPNQNKVDIVGHEKTQTELLNAYQEKRFPHGILLTGPEGIGKATLALQLACYLLAREEEREEGMRTALDSQATRQIHNGAHPDFFIAQPPFDDAKGVRKNALDAETIRKIAPFLRLRPSHKGGWRVVIVDGAHTMTNAAQNSLLKILEEPPAHAVLILISKTTGHLLPTIKSRVQHFAMTALTHKEMTKLLPQLTSDIEDMDSILSLSDGSPGKALDLMENGGLKILNEILESFEGWPKLETLKIHRFSDSLSRYDGATDKFGLFKDQFLWLIRQGIRHKATARKQAYPEVLSDFTSVKAFFEKFDMHELTNIHDRIKSILDMTQHQSLDKKNAILQSYNILKTGAR